MPKPKVPSDRNTPSVRAAEVRKNNARVIELANDIAFCAMMVRHCIVCDMHDSAVINARTLKITLDEMRTLLGD